MASKIELLEGKYTVVIPDDWKKEKFEALRYGEKWRDLCGDGLMLALAMKVEKLQEENKTLRSDPALSEAWEKTTKLVAGEAVEVVSKADEKTKQWQENCAALSKKNDKLVEDVEFGADLLKSVRQQERIAIDMLDLAHHWLMNLIQTNDRDRHNWVLENRPDGADLVGFHSLLSAHQLDGGESDKESK